jgi:hypothetical protein
VAEHPGYLVYQEPPQRPLTARNLADYALCPQKFLLSFFATRSQTERFLGGPVALQTAARAALIECYRQGGTAAVAEERLLALFEQHWEGRLCADSLEEEQLHAQGLQILRAYHAAHLTEAETTVALDLRLEETLGEHRFVAVADRVIEDPGGTLTLLRFKTVRQAPSARALGKDLSIALLALLGERHFGRPVQVGIAHLRSGKLLIADLPPAQLEEWEVEVQRQAALIRAARDYPTNKGRICGVCRSRPQCPAWHPQPLAEEIW